VKGRKSLEDVFFTKTSVGCPVLRDGEDVKVAPFDQNAQHDRFLKIIQTKLSPLYGGFFSCPQTRSDRPKG